MPIKYKYLSPLLFFACVACSNDIEPNFDFKVTLDPTNVYKVNTPVSFDIEGNPNFIIFYSGEPGAEYCNKDRTHVTGINPQLLFKLKRSQGNDNSKFYFKVSTDFAGIKQLFGSDSLAIEHATWDDLTQLAKIETTPSRKAVEQEIKIIDFPDKYLNSPITIAYEYIDGNVSGTQFMMQWVLSEFKHLNDMVVGKEVTQETINNINTAQFNAIDLNKRAFWEADVAPFSKTYKSTQSSSDQKGDWTFKDGIYTLQWDRNVPFIHHDWLISSPISLYGTKSVAKDLGESIKNISSRLTKYKHVFKTPGTYIVTFDGGSVDVFGSKYMQQQLTITIEK